MEIKRSADIEKWLFDEIRNNWGKEARDNIHLTDLLAPRKAYFQRMKPQYPTDDEIMYWLTGRGHEGVLLRSADYRHGETKEKYGIWYSPDVLFNFPAEVKTRRRNLAEDGKESEEYEYYLKQLKGYCALEEKNQGWLIIWSLVEKQDDGSTKPELACYNVTFSEEELKQYEIELLNIKTALEMTLSGIGNHLSLPECPSWMCGREKKIMVEKPFCETCQRFFDTEWGINKHINSRTGNGHKVRMPEYKTEFEIKCKWFMDCKGERRG